MIAVAAGLLIPTFALSQDATNAALATIKKAADDICGTVKQDGSSTRLDVTGTIGGTVNLNIGGVLKDLIGTLIDGNASISGAWNRKIIKEYFAKILRV
jgi:hypothetical protein